MKTVQQQLQVGALDSKGQPHLRAHTSPVLWLVVSARKSLGDTEKGVREQEGVGGNPQGRGAEGQGVSFSSKVH